MFLIWIVMAMWILGAIARQGLLVTLRSLIVSLIALFVVWHEVGTWLMAPVSH